MNQVAHTAATATGMATNIHFSKLTDNACLAKVLTNWAFVGVPISVPMPPILEA